MKKTSFNLLQLMKMPKFPAVEIDGMVVFEGCDVTVEQLEAALRKRQAG